MLAIASYRWVPDGPKAYRATMRTRAALLLEQPGAWQVVDVDLDDPQDGEVLVRLAAAGLCRSDDHVARAEGIIGHFPHCGGHEGAGVVEAVGPGVHDLSPGDHVVLAFIPSCGRCRFCARGQQNLCSRGALIGRGSQVDGSYRMRFEGRGVGKSGLIGSFAEYTVVSQMSCVPVPKDLPLRSAALLACGVPTGWGSAVNAAEVAPGDVVIVLGVGGIGMNAVQGAAHAGARRVIAVDPVAMKRDAATGFGATDAFATAAEAADLARSLTDGQGADATIICVGVLDGDDVSDAVDSIRKGGTVVVTAVARSGVAALPLNLLMFAMYQKRIQGCLFGTMSPMEGIPRLVDLYQQGILKLDELITATYSLDDVNQGYQDLHAGRNIRGLIEF
jgi:NDMA-dependent alcohol dehydrogenase